MDLSIRYLARTVQLVDLIAGNADTPEWLKAVIADSETLAEAKAYLAEPAWEEDPATGCHRPYVSGRQLIAYVSTATDEQLRGLVGESA